MHAKYDLMLLRTSRKRNFILHLYATCVSNFLSKISVLNAFTHKKQHEENWAWELSFKWQCVLIKYRMIDYKTTSYLFGQSKYKIHIVNLGLLRRLNALMNCDSIRIPVC